MEKSLHFIIKKTITATMKKKGKRIWKDEKEKADNWHS